ncbi:MAG TPA: hypothetical protein VN238_05470, partial [Solirubrobacteraceae bacterium]|nr:hypothetical protein [Solirubrobacteraceae bacterium]
MGKRSRRNKEQAAASAPDDAAVEAALDDPNITRFLELLRRYADRAQFIVVTHQKRTMEAADTLYGVSMGDDGVSKVVSRRLP